MVKPSLIKIISEGGRPKVRDTTFTNHKNVCIQAFYINLM